MGTRSDIIAKSIVKSKVRWSRIYCHWDGYPSHNGKILFEHFTDQKKIDALIKLGNLSVLAPSIEKPAGHSFDKAVDGYTVFYGRDRGENDIAPVVGDTLASVWPSMSEGGVGGTEFTYVWDGGMWHVGDPDLTPESCHTLASVLEGKNKILSNVYAWGSVKIGKRTALPSMTKDRTS